MIIRAMLGLAVPATVLFIVYLLLCLAAPLWVRPSLRDRYQQALADGDTQAPDEDAFVEEELGAALLKSRAKLAVLIFGLPAALYGIIHLAASLH